MAAFNFLHVCGGVSAKYLDEDVEHAFSPRMWRCFLSLIEPRQLPNIFSTYVEVFLLPDTVERCRKYFLHVCGGVS